MCRIVSNQRFYFNSEMTYSAAERKKIARTLSAFLSGDGGDEKNETKKK